MEKLKAAIANGADAVYLGAKGFSARATAENFETKELVEAISLCQSHGKKAYLAINTLIKDSELSDAIGLAKEAYIAGIDAVIVQDLGLVYALRKLLPDLRLHASTQMTCHNKQGAEFLASLGIKRIVLSRELSLREVTEIKSILDPLGVEIECFVHGAYCFSFSGQCLFSSFAFNKSGNRGRCLQPCRMEYELKRQDGAGAEMHRGFLLSMKDLNGMESIPSLIDAGIHAFKIEGRLKDAAYVAATARAYRKAIDSHFGAEPPSERELKDLRQAFLRDSTTGYISGKYDLVSPKTPQPLGEPAAIVLEEKSDRIKLRLLSTISKGCHLTVPIKDSLPEFVVNEIILSRRRAGRANRGDIVDIKTGERPQLRVGETIYNKIIHANNAPIVLNPGPHSVIKRELDTRAFEAKNSELLQEIRAPFHSTAQPEVVVFTDTEHIKIAAGFYGADLFVGYAANEKQVEYIKKSLPGKTLLFKTPNIQTSAELDAYAGIIASEKVVCSNLGALQLVVKSNRPFWAGRELNIFNSLAVLFMSKLGAETLEPSVELSLSQLSAMTSKGKLLPLIFFYPLLMTSRAYSKSFSLKGKSYTMTDRMGYKYFVTLDDRRLMRIYNPVPVDMIPELDKFLGFGLIGIDLSATSPGEATGALKRLNMHSQERVPSHFTRGHYAKDVE